MNILHAIIIGIVEGLTEFLPISSTFHQIWTAHLLGIQQTNFTKLFEVFIQVGAIVAVIILYFKTIKTNRELVKKVLVAFLPTAVIGFVLYKVITDVFFVSPILMLSVFIGIGIVFIVYEFFLSKRKTHLRRSLTSFTYTEAVIIGVVQAAAVVPGVSRAGAVLLGMMVLGFKRDEAAEFSFLLAIPTLFAASGYDLFKMRKELTTSPDHILLLSVGTIAAFVSAYIVVKWFIRFLQTHSLSGFGWYRIVVGILLFFVK